MAYSDPNKYIKKANLHGFAASRYGLLGPFIGIGMLELIKILDIKEMVK